MTFGGGRDIPDDPSSLDKSQLGLLRQVVSAGDQDHHVVVSPGFEDEIQAMGGRIAHCIEVP